MSYDLCEEMILEIFSRLPSKSLLRFRSISKSLYTSIGSPDFIRLHALRSPEKVLIKHKIQKKHYFYTLHLEADQFPYNNNNNNTAGITPVAHPFSDFRVIGSCNGILCLCKYEHNLILWNPSTRRNVTVPNSPIWQGNQRSEFEFVFGFDPVIDDYKILRITNPQYYSSYVYTMKARTWRAITSSPAADSCPNSHHCLFNGASHCVAFRNDGADRYHHFIMKFDLTSEVFSEIELAEPSWEKSVVSTIKGCLAVMSSKDDSTWIWVMREYCNHGSWCVAFKLNACQSNVADRFYTANDDHLILLDHLCEGIIAYNPVTHERSKLLDFIDSNSSMVCMTMCIESLELLDMGTVC